jgi:ATP-binding cassette subfamily B protein
MRAFKWHFAIMLFAPAVSSFYPFAYNYAVKLFIDTMSADDVISFSSLIFPITLFLGTHFFMDLTWRMSNVAEWRSEPYVRQSLLVKSYAYVQNHPFIFFQNNFTGAISSKIKGIIDGYDKWWSEIHHGLFPRLAKSIVSIGTLFFIHATLGIFMLFWGLIYGITMYRLTMKLNTLTFEETESRHYLIGQVSDKIANILSIFSFAAKKSEYESLDKAVREDFIPKQIKSYKYAFKIQLTGGIFYIIMFAILLLLMINLRIQSAITVGDFAFVFGIALITAEEIWSATISLQDFSRAMGDLRSAISLLQLEHSEKDVPNAKELEIGQGKIEFKNLCLSYNDQHTVFQDLSLTIKAGEKIGLVGHSGAGKSSLVSVLLRYFKPQSGSIFIDGQNINLVTEDSLRKAIAVIPQDVALFHRSLEENIQFGRPEATKEELIEASKKAHVHDFIEGLPEAYETPVGERGVKLSGGQRQRISIARALLKDAPILVLDEATSALDSETEKLIQESLNLLIDDKKKTVIAIAHRLSTLKHMDRIIVLDHGKIVEEGSHDELLANQNSHYKRMWELQEI